MYSKARTRAKTPRHLEGSDLIVQRCVDIIGYWKPRFWATENAQMSTLKTRDVVQGLRWKDLDYCAYQVPGMYRKRTRLWTNCTGWARKPPCAHASHPHSAQRGPQKMRGKGCLLPDDVFRVQTLHHVPFALTTELMVS